MKTKTNKKITAYVLAVIAALALTGCNAADVQNLIGVDVKISNGAAKADEGDTSVKTPPPVIHVTSNEPSVITDTEDEPEEELPEYEEIYDPVGKEYSIVCADSGNVTLAFVGDVGFAQGYATINKYRSNGSDIHKSLDEGVLSTMESVDIMMANNEFPYSDRGTPTANKTYTFRADPKDVHIMKDMGVDIVSLANNHAYDYGPDALIDTVDTLNDAKLPFVGAGKNFEEAAHPAYFHANGHVISYVSATQIERYGNPDTKEATADSPGVLRTLDPAKAVAAIQEAKANSDFTVMYVHWGSESTDLVEKSQRDLARAYVDAGADLIIGDHSHCLQGIDYVDDVPVFYSLGNFWFSSKTIDTCIVKVTLDSDCALSEVKFIPCIQRGSGVASCTADEKSRIIAYMRGISNYAEIDDDGIVTKSDKDHNTQNGQNTSPQRKSPEQAVDDADALQQLQQLQDAAAQPQAEAAPQETQEALPDWAVQTE